MKTSNERFWTKNRVIRTPTEKKTETSLWRPMQYTYIPNTLWAVTHENELGILSSLCCFWPFCNSPNYPVLFVSRFSLLLSPSNAHDWLEFKYMQMFSSCRVIVLRTHWKEKHFGSGFVHLEFLVVLNDIQLSSSKVRL